jgi:hypothetical protein
MDHVLMCLLDSLPPSLFASLQILLASTSRQFCFGQTMDFKILSKYDDLCASLFLDDQYLWFDTIKMNDDQVRADTPSHVIQQIIFDHVIVNRKVTHAAKELLS